MEVEVEEKTPVAPILGDDAQLLITLNSKLSTLGIKDTIKLPTIVVLGDQSTGKSSTVEAISTISVPKASGLCTCCPISLSMSDAGTSGWQCSVLVEEQFAFDPTVKQKRVSRVNKLGPWKPVSVPIVTHIETTQDPTKLIDLIKKAQDKILNPSGKRQSLGPNSIPQPETFSPNIIRLELSIPKCAPLHFVDLPGVIASSGREQPEYYVDVVKSLAAHYCKDDSNLLLLTLPANHDVSNSNAYSLLQKHAATSRCLAVFTKVDICRDEERDSILGRYFGEGAQAEQEEEEFEYGNHIVMLRTAGSVEEVKAAEEAFFSEQPWDQLRSATRECLGVGKLSDRISRILIQKTAESLPANLESILNRATIVENELEDMPQPPDTTALPYELRTHMSTFDTNMRSFFSQTSETPSPRSTLIDLMQKFHRQVVELSRPSVSIKTKSEMKQQKDAQQGLATEDSGTGTAASNDDRANQSSSTKSETPSSQTRNAASDGPHCFHLERVRQINKDHYSSSIPGDIELKAVSAMHRLAVNNWDKLFAKFMQEIKRTIKAEVLSCVHSTFDPISHLPAYERIVNIADNYLDHVIGEEGLRLRNLCESERSHPLTFDDSSMRTAEAKTLAFLRQRREEARLAVEKDIRKANANGRRIREPTAADIGPDEFDLEIQMAAKTRAYYEVASHRFVDTVCLNICAQLIPRCEAGLTSHMRDTLGLNNISENRAFLVELMTEDGEREALRRAKVSELDRLKTGYNYIANVLNTLQGRSSELSHHSGAFLHHPGTFLNQIDPENNFDYYRSVREDPFAVRTDISPNKRKIEDADFESEMDTFSTPSKRQRETAQRGYQSNSGPSNSRAHLPSRPRSVDPDE